jgi:hypothetical protein
MDFEPFWELLDNLGISLPNRNRIEKQGRAEKPSPPPKNSRDGKRRPNGPPSSGPPPNPMELLDMLEGIFLIEALGEMQGRSPRPSCWVPADQTVEVGGYTIPGMVYVGDSLASVRNYNTPEISLIYPKLKVGSQPNFKEDLQQFQVPYGQMRPASRAAYLEWLATGRRSEQVSKNHLWLFFYGLERRVFYDLLGSASSNRPKEQSEIINELDLILAEVRQLQQTYGDRDRYSGFDHKAELFITLANVIGHKQTLYPTIDPLEAHLLFLQIALGQLVVNKQPIPPDWAFAWYTRLSRTKVRATMNRCIEELKALFTLRYGQEFGAGMTLKPGKAVLPVRYYPASPSLPQKLDLSLDDLPDLANYKSKLKVIGDLIEDCAAQLQPLARFLGRNPDGRQTAAAIALLPPELLSSHGGDRLAELQTWLTNAIDQNPIAISVQELLQHWAGANPEKLNKSEAEGLAKLLEKLGYGIEPDVRLGGALPKVGNSVALFPLDADTLTYLSPEYVTITLTAYLAIAAANGEDLPTPIEQAYLNRQLPQLIPLTQAERSRLQAHVELLLQEKPALRNLKTRIEAVEPSQRVAIARFIVSVAVADGQASPPEIDRLSKIYKLLELDVKTLYSDVHDCSTKPAIEPITVRAATPTQGHKVPPKGSPKLTLNMDLIESKISESQEISDLLSDIFVEESSAQPAAKSAAKPAPKTAAKPAAKSTRKTKATPPKTEPKITEPPIAGLDLPHSQLLRALSQQVEWQRSDLEAIATSLSLMLDGALEVINDVAFDQCDEAVIEGDDPFEVNLDVLEELLA